MVRRVKRWQVRYSSVPSIGFWEHFAAWRPRQRQVGDLDQDLHASQETLLPAPQKRTIREDRENVEKRIRQSQVNACFIGIYAILGVSLALANAAPNQERAEVETLGLLLVLLLIPLAFNRTGAVFMASVILTLLPTVALVATFMQPLPSGQSVLTWTYDAGLAFAGFGALEATLTLRPWVAWCLIGGGIILPLSILIALMPHAPSLVGLDVAGGIISSHWSVHHQQLYAVYDFLFRPFLLTVLLGLVGARLRKSLLSK